jgi:hypothetical protein
MNVSRQIVGKTTESAPLQRVDKRLILAIPSYGPVDPGLQKNVRVAMMIAAKYGVQWVGDASPDRMGFSAARGAVAQACLDCPDADGVMWIDSDMDIPALGIWKLMLDVEAHNAEFATGIYHQREKPHFPLVAWYNPAIHKFSWYTKFPDNVMAPVDGCGFGFVYTSKLLLRKIANLPDFDHKVGFFPDTRDVEGGMGEDFAFCLFAKKAGVQLYADTSVQLGHAGRARIVTAEDFEKEREQLIAEGKAEDKPIGEALYEPTEASQAC